MPPVSEVDVIKVRDVSTGIELPRWHHRPVPGAPPARRARPPSRPSALHCVASCSPVASEEPEAELPEAAFVTVGPRRCRSSIGFRARPALRAAEVRPRRRHRPRAPLHRRRDRRAGHRSGRSIRRSSVRRSPPRVPRDRHAPRLRWPCPGQACAERPGLGRAQRAGDDAPSLRRAAQ